MPPARSRCLSQPRTLQILAIGSSPLALRGCGADCTLCGLPTSASNGVSHLGQAEAPFFAGPLPLALQRVRGYDTSASHFQHLTTFNAQEGSHRTGINERLEVVNNTHLRFTSSLPARTPCPARSSVQLEVRS